MAGSAVDPRELRVSDAERAHVMALLEKATGRGLINLAEYEERSAIAVNAKTRADLNAVLLDLPGLVVAGEPASAAPGGPLQQVPGANPGRVEFGAPPAGPGAPPMGPSPSVLDLTGRGSRDLRGYWVVPARIVIGGAGAATRLDFCDAQLTSPTVRVEFAGKRTGSVELIVPPGCAVRMDELDLRSGRVDNRAQPPAGGSPSMVLVLAGAPRGGWIRICNKRMGLFGWG